MQTVNRGWLKKQIANGKVEAKCRYAMTDDYRFDNANEFGKTDWMQARFYYPVFGKVTLQNGITITRCEKDDRKEGQANFSESDLKTKSGAAYRNDDGTITLRIHSNEVWTLRVAA